MRKSEKALACLSGVALLCLGAGYNSPAGSMDFNGQTTITNLTVRKSAPKVAGGGTSSVNSRGKGFSMAGTAPQPGQPQVAGEDLAGPLDPLMYSRILEANRRRTAADVKSGKVAPLPVTSLTPRGAPGTLPEGDGAATTSSIVSRRSTSELIKLIEDGGL